MYLLTAVAQPLQTSLALTRSLGPRLSSMRSSNVVSSSIGRKALNILGRSRRGLMMSKAPNDLEGWYWGWGVGDGLAQRGHLVSCRMATQPQPTALPPLLKFRRQISPPLPPHILCVSNHCKLFLSKVDDIPKYMYIAYQILRVIALYYWFNWQSLGPNDILLPKTPWLIRMTVG